MTCEALVIGYGNTIRGDDGIGPAVANAIEALAIPGVRTFAVHQLTPELAAEIAEARSVIFVDAAVNVESVRIVAIEAESPASTLAHSSNPRGLLALTNAVYGRTPPAWLATAGGADFGFGTDLSPVAQGNAKRLSEQIESVVRSGQCESLEKADGA